MRVCTACVIRYSKIYFFCCVSASSSAREGTLTIIKACQTPVCGAPDINMDAVVRVRGVGDSSVYE
jgi:hypothetical protein